MPTIRKFGEDYYLCTVKTRRKGTRGHKKRIFKNTFLVKFGQYIQGKISMGRLQKVNIQIHCPNELIGKKIRLKVEVRKNERRRS